MTQELEILLGNLSACGQRISKLSYSLNKNKDLLPLTAEKVTALDDDQEESIDALILRYSQSVAMIQDQIFRGIAYIEQENLSDKTNRDKALLMEKIGAIRSAEEFGAATVLRNKFSHHYPEEVGSRIERLNLVVQEAQYVIETFTDILAYLKRKGFIDSSK